MARADLILNLVRAGARGDQVLFEKTVEALAADERAKNHGILAERLVQSFQQNKHTVARRLEDSSTRVVQNSLFMEKTPNRSLSDLLLPKAVKQAVLELLEEQNRADMLRSFGLEPRHRILLAGPPGNGKTTLAEGIADALNAPLLSIRYDAIIGSYLGETAQRINQVFEYARSRQCVLFFDEFDAIGKERGDVHETGEIKRVVSSLLLQIDALPSYVVIIVASNHPELLDRAVWRRFQLRCELPQPTQALVEEWFQRFEERTGHSLGASRRSLARSLKGASFAEVEDFGLDVLRRIALESPEADAARITKERMTQWKGRYSQKSLQEDGKVAD